MYLRVLRPLGSIIGLAGLAVSVGLVNGLNTRPLFAQKEEYPKVAIIGAGIGGTAAAYFIRQGLGPNVTIDVFEKGNRVGGRMAVVEIGGNSFEAGASVIHESNKYMQEFTKLSDLKRLKNDLSSSMGIYDGNEFVYLSTGYSFLDKLKLFWRYGMGLIKMNRFTEDTMNKFLAIYKLQDEGKSFETVREFLEALGGNEFVTMTQKSTRQILEDAKVSKKIIDELATAVTRVNYGQDMGVNAFTGFVSLAGAQSAKLWAVEGGNYQVCKRILEKSGANVKLNKYVKEIDKKIADDKTIKYRLRTDDFDSGYVYDAVVVAVPLEVKSTKIKCIACSQWPDVEQLGRYQRTVATFVKGEINHKAFGVEKASDLPMDIFTTENPALSFSSIGLQETVEGKPGATDGNPIYKVFSRNLLTEEELNHLFSVKMEVKAVDWLAYPHYHPPERFSPFKLDTGVFYVNAIERVASAMEMGAISGRNAALLVKKYLGSSEDSNGKGKRTTVKGEL